MNKKEKMQLIKEAYVKATEEGTIRIRPVEFNYDLDRMKEVVESPYVTLPTGMNSEEINDFLMNVKLDDYIHEQDTVKRKHIWEDNKELNEWVTSLQNNNLDECEFDNWLDKN